jgi:hypothetical protein
MTIQITEFATQVALRSYGEVRKAYRRYKADCDRLDRTDRLVQAHRVSRRNCR